MVNDVRLSVAEEYSAYPAGRDEGDGDWNGEKFRRDFLLPRYNAAKEADAKLVVSFKGVKSFGSSFLEEAFGGLVRKEGVQKADLERRLTFELDSQSSTRYERAIRRYIKEAR